MELPEKVVNFLRSKGFVIVSSIDSKGRIHCSAKGIVGIEKEGKVFVIDVYKKKTFDNLTRDSRVSITSIDEDKFVGFTLQGKAKIVLRKDIEEYIVAKYENRIINRISKRIAKSIQSGTRSQTHFEAHLPKHPKYLIEVDVENIIDLAPPLKK